MKKSGVTITLNKIHKKFGHKNILNNINLTIKSGQFVAIVGRSGCGKSTLLRLLAGLEMESQGHLQFNGESLKKASIDTRLMFQDDRLLPWKKVIDNIGLGLSGNWHERARNALESVGLADKADVWPSTLSGGQKQRIALARALVHKPNLLLLDEPLGALDALTRIEMQKLIEKLWQQYQFTVVLVTHDVSEAVILADRIVLIDEGKIGLDLEVGLKRSRHKKTQALIDLEELVLDHILHRNHVKNIKPMLSMVI